MINVFGDPSENPASGCQILILSDGKPGHLNQSIAFARLLRRGYRVARVRFRNRLCKGLSYLLDRIGMYSPWLFQIEGEVAPARVVVSTGSSTYYANRVLARKLAARSIVLMWPGGYRPEFDLILAQQHDQPPERDNLVAIPVNLSAPVSKGFVDNGPVGTTCVAVIIGGPSKHYHFDLHQLEQQLQQIFQAFPDGDFLVTTSRRTPLEAEVMLENFPFRYRLLFSRQQDNPIPDFLEQADYVFITEDSTSMVSEAVCWGRGAVEVLPLSATGSVNKISQMMNTLAENGCLHRFDGSLGGKNRKINLSRILYDSVPESWLR